MEFPQTPASWLSFFIKEDPSVRSWAAEEAWPAQQRGKITAASAGADGSEPVSTAPRITPENKEPCAFLCCLPRRRGHPRSPRRSSLKERLGRRRSFLRSTQSPVHASMTLSYLKPHRERHFHHGRAHTM